MPAKPRWLIRIPEIVERLNALTCPVIDRQAVEDLFGVRRRQAIHLLNRFGGFQLGRTYAVDRSYLIRQLERMRQDPDWWREAARRRRFARTLSELHSASRAMQITLPPEAAMPPHEPSGFPPGVYVECGELRVPFNSALELLGKLYAVAQAAAEDLDAFQTALDRAAHGGG